MRNFNFSGHFVEDGANWIQGQYNEGDCGEDGSDCDEKTSKFVNPVWKWNRKAEGKTWQMKGNFTDYDDNTIIMENGTAVSQNNSDKYWDGLDKTEAACQQKVLQVWKNYCNTGMHMDRLELHDTSIMSCFIDNYPNYYSLKADERKIVNALLWEEVEFETAIFKGSLLHNIPLNNERREAYNDRDFLITDQRGYSSFVEKIAEKFAKNIMLNELVIGIDYSDEGVTVTTENSERNTVTTIKANYAICTLPLGVLKNPGRLAFNPAFPQDKLGAINGYTMGNYAKIYVKFPQNFWGNNEVLMYVGKELPENSIVTWGLNLDHPKYFDGSKMLTFH